jgi:predicted alpha/beta-fold hydrolase
MNYDQSNSRIDLTFCPHPLVRHYHLQTIIASRRACKAPHLERNSQMAILEVDEGILLQGFYSPQRNGSSRGLVLLLHGWLGCMESPYVMTLGEYLYRQQYDIFRLNLRDHGETHHLNTGIFRGDQLDEVFAAAQQIARLAEGRPLYMVGFSLGGNFALRLAWKHSQAPLPNLRHTVAVCPAIDPCHTALSLDKHPIYLSYFRRRWCRAFKTKQKIFPKLYDFSQETAAPTCMAMTEAFVAQCCDHDTAQSYFDAYKVTPDMMRSLISPVTILAAADDPVVPHEDFEPFYDLSSHLQVSMQPWGGHVGFIDIFPFRYWVNGFVQMILEAETENERIPEISGERLRSELSL